MVHITIEELQAKLKSVFFQYGIREAILFGSYAKGTATEDSDIDLLVDSGRKGLDFIEFINEVRKAVDREVDIIDVAHIEHGSKIEEEIHLTGVRIYGD